METPSGKVVAERWRRGGSGSGGGMAVVAGVGAQGGSSSSVEVGGSPELVSSCPLWSCAGVADNAWTKL